MRILTLSLLLTVCQLTAEAQLYNQGATIKVQTGALIFVQGDAQNTSGGSINNDGKIEVQGSFTNTATYTSTSGDDSLILSGGGNVTLNGGASSYNYLTINKTANSNIVKLTGSTTVNTKLDYFSGNFTTDPILNPTFVLSAPVTAAFNFTAGREITGRVRRTGWTNSAVSVFNQPNMQVSTAGGVAPTDFTVLMIPQTEGGDPSLAEREVKRTYGFTQTGGSGFTADIRFPYIGTELNTNTETNLVPWQLITGEWNGRLTPVSRDAVNDYVITTGIPAADLGNEWKLADPRYTMNATALLRGPVSGTSMTTSLNGAGLIPLNQPYNITPFNYSGTESVASIPANVVDWVLVEMRKPSTGLPADATSASIIGRKAGFILNNGTVVDLDGITPLAFDINKQGAGFMTIRHRNHLGVLSVSLPSNATGSYANDFRTLANSYKAVGAPSDPVVLVTGSTYALWAGDANRSGNLSATDVNAIKAGIAGSASGYLFTDVNLTANLAASDVNLTKLMISNSGTGSMPGRTIQAKTNIPDGMGPDQ